MQCLTDGDVAVADLLRSPGCLVWGAVLHKVCQPVCCLCQFGVRQLVPSDVCGTVAETSSVRRVRVEQAPNACVPQPIPCTSWQSCVIAETYVRITCQPEFVCNYPVIVRVQCCIVHIQHHAIQNPSNHTEHARVPLDLRKQASCVRIHETQQLPNALFLREMLCNHAMLIQRYVGAFEWTTCGSTTPTRCVSRLLTSMATTLYSLCASLSTEISGGTQYSPSATASSSVCCAAEA